MTLDPLTPSPLYRPQALRNQIRRLEARLSQLEALDRRYSWYRLMVFILGVIAVAAAAFLDGDLRLALLGALLAFSVVVALHRRLEGWIARHRIWLEMRRSQAARLDLDWEHIGASPAEQQLPARGSLDIDLDLSGARSLHRLLDQTVSVGGSRLLAEWLAQPIPQVEEIVERQAVVQELVDLPRFRDRLRLNLRLVSAKPLQGERLLRWLDVEFPARRLKGLLLAATLFTLLNAALFLAYIAGWLPAYWIYTLILYMVFYFANSGAVSGFLEAVVELDEELGKFRPVLRFLETYPYGRRQNLRQLCAPFCSDEPPSRQLRRIRWVTAAVGLRSNPLLGLLLNAVLPWDFLFGYLAGNLRQRAAATIPLWLDAWHRLDALCSLAGFAYLHPGYVFPQFLPVGKFSTAGGEMEPVLQARDLGHPLIPEERRVGNDLTIPRLGEVLLVTGSNMSGKSTWLKTLGVNLCLAYAGGPVCAAALRLQPLRLHTCMRISDSITDGFSYFYAEVKCLRLLLDELREEHPLPLFYLIDEIFRGTNNRERLAGSRAFARALIGARGAGLIATHDLELARLAESSPQVHNLHFRDEIAEGRLVFDYKLRPGASPTTNALKIMQLEGLPVDDDSVE
jgi:hypothetical protein